MEKTGNILISHRCLLIFVEKSIVEGHEFSRDFLFKDVIAGKN